MGIKNNICLECDHSEVCYIYKDILSLFKDESKIPKDVDIIIDNCLHYKEIENLWE